MKTDYGEALPEDVVGHNGDTGRRLHNIYTLLYNRCVFEASQRTVTRMELSGDAPVGLADSAIQYSGAAIRRAIGKAWQPAFVGASRGA